MKRIKIVPDRPNRQFETWLEEWRDHAMLRNSELCGQFTKALDSLKRYPLPLESGKECIILQHFGTKLCSMLDKKLEEQRRHESVKTIVDADCITASRKQLLDDKVVEMQEKTARVRQARNTKQSAPKKLANIDEIASKENDRQIYLESNAFDIILLVDTQETCGGKTKPQHDATLMELTQFGVLFEVRRLKIGDFMWIARCRKTQDELVIPYIIERKRMDDLSASITDGRFHEQKFRLKQSKIENLMYIVENIDKNSRFSIPLPSLLQASVNCLIQDGFTVKYTRNHKDSMSYLSCVTKTLIKIYKDKKLVGCKKERLLQTNNLDSTIRLMEFKEFNKASSKQRKFKVSEMFIRQLLQLKGMSVDRATAIVERYPSPQILIIALENSVNGEQLLANIQVGDKKRQLGSSIIVVGPPKQMEFSLDRYYKLNRLLLSGIGLWPYQSATNAWIQRVFAISFMIWGVIVQIAKMCMSELTMDFTLDCLPILIPNIGILLQFIDRIIINDKLKSLLDHIKIDWERTRSRNDIKIMRKYAASARLITILFSFYTTMGLSVYIFITILPQILDVFLPLNETRSREHPFRMEFFIDEEKFFYLIRIQMYLIIILMMVTILANGTVFVVYTRHASGMFTILGNRAEHLFSERSSKFGRSNRRTEKEYRNIVLFVEDHRNVIQYVLHRVNM